MIVRLDLESLAPDVHAYRVSYERETLFDDTGLESLPDALVAAIEGLSPDVVAVEVAYNDIVSGTYPLQVIAMNWQQIAQHAANTTAAVIEALEQR